MKKVLFLVAVATLFIASCQKEIDPSKQDNKDKRFTFKASIEQLDSPVKGTINEENQLVWKSGDKIGIYVNDPNWKDKNQPFTLVGEGGDTVGEFAWDFTGDFSPYANAAFYPWQGTGSSKNNVYDGVMYFKLPSEYWDYQSGDMLTPIVASLGSSSDYIAFKHAGAAVKLTVNNLITGTYKVKMSVTGEQITGDFHIAPASAGSAAMTLDAAEDDSKNHITLNTWKSNGAFSWIFPVPELTKPKLQFEIIDNNGVPVMSKNLKAQADDLRRGDILIMPALDITPYEKFIKDDNCEWSFSGNINGSTWQDNVTMVSDGRYWILAGCTFNAGDEFKIRKNKKWDEAYPSSNWKFTSEVKGAKDIIFDSQDHSIKVVDRHFPYPSPKVTLYFGINSSGGKGIALSSSTLAPGAEWPGLTLTEREYINNKWYYKHVVDGGAVWGKSISSVYIVGIDQWNTNASTVSFNEMKTEYYFEATSGEDLVLLSGRPSEVHYPITIGNDLSDWNDVPGVTVGNNTVKAESDDDNLYFYSARTNASGDYAAIWNSVGYVYVTLDLDNDPSTAGSGDIYGNKGDFVGLLYPYAGTSASPAFYTSPTGNWQASPSPYTISHISLYGEETSGTAAIEFSIPRDDLPDIPSSAPITIKVFGNKGMSTVSILRKL